jgi:hypothetical protein
LLTAKSAVIQKLLKPKEMLKEFQKDWLFTLTFCADRIDVWDHYFFGISLLFLLKFKKCS